MGGDSGRSAIGFLASPTCNQDENHFNWILSHLLNTDDVFRLKFLERSMGLDEAARVEGFDAAYQEHAVSSIPDVKVTFASAAGRHLVFIETKVESPVDRDQLKRHYEGLQKEKWLIESPGLQASTAVILLAPRATIPNDLPATVKPIAWEDVHEMLIRAHMEDSTTSTAHELAQVLEARGLADFAGFDTEAWKEYLQMRAQHEAVIRRMTEQAGNFVASVRNATNRAVFEGKAPFDRFNEANPTRGRPLEFFIFPKAAKAQSHWGHVRVQLEEGWIEASSGTSTTRNSSPFLENVGRSETELSKEGWKLWYSAGGIEHDTYLSSWKSLLDQKVTEIALSRSRDLAADKDLLSSIKVVEETYNDLTTACRFLIGLTG